MNETIKLSKPILGINNVAADTDLPEGFLTEAINVTLDKEGNVRRRDGYTKVYSGQNIHSLYKRYFVENSILKYLEDDNTATIVDSNIALNSYIAWETIFKKIYYSDGKQNKTIGGKQWGLSTPNDNPTLTETSGQLNKGTYQITVCFRDPETKELSGALLATKITVNNNGGILCSNFPKSPEEYEIVLYVSTQNGTQLYQHIILPFDTEFYTILFSNKSTRQLNTQFMSPIPSGHIIRHFKARVYAAKDNILWYSEPFRFGLCSIAHNFFQFPSRITVVQAVEDGIFVVADKTYFLAGTEPKSMQQRILSKHTAIEGTGKTMGGETFAPDGQDGTGLYVGYWFSNSGAVIGLPGGVIRELTDDQVAIPTGLTYGSTTYKKKQGIKQMITNFTNNGNASSFAFGTQATATIIRNGVVIP